MGLYRISRGNLTVHPRALLGLTPEETEVSNADKLLLAGRWFIPSDRYACILNEGQAEKLGMNETKFDPATVVIEGMNFTVVGIVGNDFENLADLDGETVMPLKFDFPPGDPNPWNEHIRYWETMIVDYTTLTSMGGNTVSLSIKFADANREVVMQSAGTVYQTLPIFAFYVNYGEAVFSYGSRTTLVIGGFQMQMVPIVTVALALLNIMLGGVYERKREIQIYNTVGLSPSSISILFLAETVVYALVGGVIGYIIGISALYPAYISSKLVTPSLERKWKIPTTPVGDVWDIPYPFIAQNDEEMHGILNFLHEFLQASMQVEAPVFSINTLNYIEGTREIRGRESQFNGLSLECRLSPYGLGVSQKMDVLASRTETERWEFQMIINRLTGGMDDWIRLNRRVLDSLRKQFLLWRSFSVEERQKYTSTQESG